MIYDIYNNSLQAKLHKTCAEKEKNTSATAS